MDKGIPKCPAKVPESYRQEQKQSREDKISFHVRYQRDSFKGNRLTPILRHGIFGRIRLYWPAKADYRHFGLRAYRRFFKNNLSQYDTRVFET
jgi:hypothetical protein